MAGSWQDKVTPVMKDFGHRNLHCHGAVFISMQSIYDLDTPHLIVDLDRLERNISEMSADIRSAGKALRPHTKTHKSPFVAGLQLSAGASGLTVAKIGEAEVLADAGFTNLFIANQAVGEIKYARILALNRRVQLVCAVDSPETALPLGMAAQRAGEVVEVMIEVDTGLGRAGCRNVNQLLETARAIESCAGLRCAGVFTHEGHLYASATDAIAGDAAAAAARMCEMRDALLASGLPCPKVSMGSTPSARAVAGQPGVDEIRPGVYVYGDRLQMQRGFARDSCALTVLTTVVSVRSDGVAILDAGSKSLASDCPFTDKTYGEEMHRSELILKGVSEEHGHLRIEDGAQVRVGDKLRIIPNHACTCVNMHDQFAVCRAESVEAVLPVAGRGKIQ